MEFETLESASKARTSLHGCDIYNNCCTMKVEYSKMETLKVRENGPMSWDFTILNRDEGKKSSDMVRADLIMISTQDLLEQDRLFSMSQT